MISNFVTAVTEDTPNFLNGFGKTVTYYPNGGGVIDIVAIVLEESRQAHFNKGNNVWDFDSIQIQISSRTDTEGRISPKEFTRKNQEGDIIGIDGKNWYLREVSTISVLGIHTLTLSDRLLWSGPWGD